MYERFYMLGSSFVYTRASGYIDNQQFIEHIHAFDRETQGRTSLLELTDVRAVTSLEKLSVSCCVNCGELDTNASRSDGGKLAVLVSNELQYGMARAFSTFVDEERRKIGIFYDLTEALNFLNTEGPIEEVIAFINSID